MPAKQRKAPVTSTAEKVRIAAAAGKAILPPEHVPLRAREMPFFNSIIKEFAKADWSDHNIELAAMLARLMAELAEEQVALQAEGTVITNIKGTKVMNPRRSVIQMNAQAILNMRRSLSLNLNIGKKEDRGSARKGAREAEDEVENDNDLVPENLLAKRVA